MEQEYKWKLPSGATADDLLPQLAGDLTIMEEKTIEMHARYYDSGAGILSGQRGALRLRQENGTSICCMKLSVQQAGGCAIREEYEIPAPDIKTGLALLPSVGAPKALCQQLQREGLWELCHIEVLRRAVEVATATLRGELCVDIGTVSGNGKARPIAEIEFELKDGDEAHFHQLAHAIEHTFSLQIEPLSKMARIL